MKKLLLFVLLFISVVANAQKGISYQAVILDPAKIEIPGQDISGQPFVNGNVSVKFVILSGTTSQFEEVQQTKTDAYGLVNLTIGSSASTAFNALTWDANQKSLQVFVSFNNGASYTKVSDQKLTYSPYALFSETAGKLGSTLEIAGGGTGATTAVGARANLGLGNVDNTADASKPISAATQTALNLKANASDVTKALALKAPLSSPTFTGTVSGISKSMVGLDAVDNTSDAAKPISTATQAALDLKSNATDVNAALDLKAPLASPAFTGTVSGIDKTMVGLGSVDNTSDAAKPISTATQAALDLKANAVDVSTALALKASLASPAFTGTVTGITKTMVGLGSVDNTSDAAKPISTATQADLSTKAPLASPALVGVPTAPTAAPGTNSTQIATTAYTTAAISAATASSGVADNSITTAKIAAGAVTDAKITSVAGSKITGVIPVASGGTGQTTVAGILSTLGFASNNIAIGSQAGTPNQGVNANTIAIGGGAARTNQGQSSIAIGYVSGDTNQGANSVSIGGNAAQGGQGAQAVAIGFAAGQNGQGANSVAIGSFAGNIQAANSIALNATGTSLNPATTGFFVDPIRNATATSNALYYNTTTREITSGAAVSGSSQWTTASSDIYYNTGNVGIGTTTPTAKLFVKGGTRNDMIRVESSDNPSISFKNTDPSGGAANIGEYQFFATGNPSNPSIAAGSFGLYYDHPSSAGYRLSVSKEGNVGIGTGLPTTKLDVAGAIKSSGTITAGTITYPNVAGTSGYYLKTDGAGTASWAAVSSGGVPYTGATGAVDLGAYDLKVNSLTVGTGAGGNTYNAVIGYNALALNTTGTYNTAIGRGVLSVNTTGSYNSGLGAQSLNFNTIGANNTGLGFQSLYKNTFGSNNTSAGYQSLKSNTIGNDNAAFGALALLLNQEGSYNTSIGIRSMFNNVFGNNNTAVGWNAGTFTGSGGSSSSSGGNNNTSLGYRALYGNTLGNDNTAIGFNSLTFNTTGAQNTTIGSGADVASGALSNAMAIGYGAQVASSNSIQLGNSSVTNVKTSGSITAGAITYPNTVGTNGQVLTTDGSGTASWGNVSIPSNVPTFAQSVTDLTTASAIVDSRITIGGLTFQYSRNGSLDGKIQIFASSTQEYQVLYSKNTAATNYSFATPLSDTLPVDLCNQTLSYYNHLSVELFRVNSGMGHSFHLDAMVDGWGRLILRVTYY